MVEAVVLWNEPNNLLHWNYHLDPEWKSFASMIRAASETIRSMHSDLPVVLGGVSSCDCDFLRRMRACGVMNYVDIVGVHGYPLDWNHWSIDEWPDRVYEARAVAGLPVWVLEVGASSFGAEEVQAFGLLKSLDLLHGNAERVYWHSLFDLPPTLPAEARDRDAESSAETRHSCLGLLKSDGTPKLAADLFPGNGSAGLCQWFQFQDPRLYEAVQWMKEHGVRSVHTGLSWADWYRPKAVEWFDRMLEALSSFEVSLTLSGTPAHLGIEEHPASPPKDPGQFAEFAGWVVERYAPRVGARNVADRRKGAVLA